MEHMFSALIKIIIQQVLFKVDLVAACTFVSVAINLQKGYPILEREDKYTSIQCRI